MELKLRRKSSAGAPDLGIFLMCMTNDAKKTNTAHGKYRQRIREPLKQSPEEHRHSRDERKKRTYTYKGTKWKNQR